VICKLQRPITPPGDPILIYNESRSVNRFMPQADVVKYFRPGELKFYAEIDWTRDGKIKTIRRLPAQNW
jgi:hypothetical protein